MATRLETLEVTRALTVLNNEAGDRIWKLEEGKLCKTFVFSNFVEAFGWMTQCAIWAEKLDHHPEWFNVYKTIDVKLITHDVDGISDLDFTLATKMDLCARYIIG